MCAAVGVVGGIKWLIVVGDFTSISWNTRMFSIEVGNPTECNSRHGLKTASSNRRLSVSKRMILKQ